MRKLARIAIHEYRRNVFKASFILTLLSVPLIIALNVAVGFYLESHDDNDLPLGYVDRAGLFTAPVEVPVSGSRQALQFTSFQTQEQAQAALESGQIQAFLFVPESYWDTRDTVIYYLEEPGSEAIRQLYDFVQINLLADQAPAAARRAALISEGVTVRSVDGRREVTRDGPTFGIIMPMLIGLAFLFLFLMNAGYLMQAVVEEKENRTIELLVTSVSPGQLIGGKVLGVVAVGLTQLATWAVVGILAVVVAAGAGIDWFQNAALDWEPIAASVILAIPSYVCAAGLMTAIGATTTSARESQATGSIFFILHVIPLYLSWLIVDTPNAAVPSLLSILPFTALLTVILRNIFTSVPMWQVAVSFALQVLYAVVALWLAGRAFRIGMLQYGQRLNWRKLIRVRSS